MARHTRRREFITLIGGAVAWPLAARAQQPNRVRRIGVLLAYPETDQKAQSWVSAFRGELGKLGWAEGTCWAVLVQSDPFLNSQPNKIVALAARHGIPAIYQWRDFVVAGGLMSYGTVLADAYR
jgi:hypothetical protein